MVYAKKFQQLISLGFILVLSFFLKIPSLFEPNHYGDEGIYQVVGQVIRSGGLLYRDAWDNKPPLLYFLYSLVNGDQFSVRLLALIVSLLTIIIFYCLSQKIFPKSFKSVLLSTLLFALFLSLPLLEGNIANAENFMFLPIILAFYLTFKNFPKTNLPLLFLSGLLFSLAFLFKIVAIFDLGAFFLFLMIGLWGQKRTQIRAVLGIFAGFVLPIFFTALFFLSRGTLKEFLSATFSQNVSYVAWGNQFLIAQGGLLLKLLLLTIFCSFLFWKRKQLSRSQLLIFLWWGFSLFNAFFAGRPWIHYLLVLVPSFCLLLGLLFAETKFRVFTLILLVLTVYFAEAKFWRYKQTPEYYANFFSFVEGKKTLDDYRSFWGGHVNRDYRMAQFLILKTAPNEPVFIWGNSAQIYALAKRRPASRYTVAYHMSFSPQAENETIQSLMKTQPRYFIILLPQSYALGKLELVLSQNYTLTFEEEGYLVYEKRL